ncbi:MAG: phosphatase [Anaerolineaceae bacterium]|nr:MAG: phosphatase [Anaerolineaceae bacterium]
MILATDKSKRSLPIPNSYWVIPRRFLAGEYPGGFNRERVRQRMDACLDAGLTTFINLTQPDELPSYTTVLREQAKAHSRDAQTIHLPIHDFGLPTREEMVNILNHIDEALARDHNVYLHCWGGIGRTGTTVGCYLVRHGMTGDEALAQLARWWENDPRRAYYPRTPETDEQVAFVREWHELA